MKILEDTILFLLSELIKATEDAQNNKRSFLLLDNNGIINEEDLETYELQLKLLKAIYTFLENNSNININNLENIFKLLKNIETKGE